MPLLELSGVSRTYPGEVPVHALRDVNLLVEQGEYLAVEGPSGSGKSTLLNQLGLLDIPTAGEYWIDGVATTPLNDAARARMRSETIAFIFQSFHLLDARTVLDNVALGTLYRGLARGRRRELAHKALEFVGLAHKEWQRASLLSGGERQRVAIARAIASGAPVVVADEPTGNLDRATGVHVMETLEALNALGTTLIVVTHDPDIAARARRQIQVLDGRVSPPAACLRPEPALDSDSTGDLRRRGAAASGPPYHPDQVPRPAGRPSRLRVGDGLRDAWEGLWSRRLRALALVAAVALGVGLALTTAGVSSTARAQVSELFDAQRNQRVALTSPDLSEIGAESAARQAVSSESLIRLRGLVGVQAVLVTASHGQAIVTTTPQSPERALASGAQPRDVLGVVGGELPSQLVTVDTQGAPLTFLSSGDVLVGAQVAAGLELGPLLAAPVVWIDGEPHRVAGVITDAGLNVGLLDAVVIPEEAAAEVGPVLWASVELRVQPGAASQVAGQAPVAWIPTDPGGIDVEAPPDPRSLRDQIESNVATMLLTLTGVTLLAAVLSLANAMTTAVYERAGEFGLRRAIGARRIHVTALVSVESLIVGLVGGVLGAYGAVIAVLAVTVVRGWQPVLDPRLLPLGLLGGILVGALGGMVATWRASRVEPSDALRA